jgi:pantoate--beta-alanine ligase
VITIQTREELLRLRQEWPRPVGFVPTMGYLHEGHLVLMRRARQESGTAVASIFVNPTQFGPNEDYFTYPRDLERDAWLAESAGIDVLFIPPVDDVYPVGYATRVEVDGPALPWEGERRPGHFRGVATIVLKLFNMVQPDAAYFGEKDYQQLQVIRQMVEDLNVPVHVVGCPTVREADGLAMSSRNSYLTPKERHQAPAIHRALEKAQEMVNDGIVDTWSISRVMYEVLAQAKDMRVDYLTIVDARTLEEMDLVDREARILAAVHLGRTRLIDNFTLLPPQQRS